MATDTEVEIVQRQASLADDQRRRFTAEEFLRLGTAGILGENDRVELIDGDIHQMTPIGPLHAGTVDHLARMIQSQLEIQFIVRIQNPVELLDNSQPQPDLAVLRARDDYYRSGHPRPADTLLVIEVADESEAYDRQVKIPRYAAAGIPEVWIVVLGRGTVEQYTEPRNDRYHSVRILEKSDVLVCQSGPRLELAVKEILA